MMEETTLRQGQELEKEESRDVEEASTHSNDSDGRVIWYKGDQSEFHSQNWIKEIT